MREKANLTKWLLCTLLLPLTVSAATEGKIIYVDAYAPGANNGSSWENAYVYLQDALTDAETADKPVEIHVAQGIYTPDQGFRQKSGDNRAYFQLINEVTIKGGFAGFSEADPNARHIEFYKTILSGDLEGNDTDVNNPGDLRGEPTRTDNSRHVVVGNNTNVSAILDGFTITGGYSIMRGIDSLFGGAGMINYSGSPTLVNCTFSGNSAAQVGGGLFNLGDSDPTLIGCTFSRNYGGSGGGIYNYDNSSPTLTNCIFHNNMSYRHGAGMRNVKSSPRLINCTISENSARSGGGISDSGSNTMLINCVFTMNRAENSGGGMYNYNSCHPTLANCTFVGNSADKGNALACDSWQENPSNIELTNCILWDGGDEISNGDGSIINITYSTVRGQWPGKGNIDVDPCFAGPGYWDANGTPDEASDDFWVDGDYHLKSQAGRWDPDSESWVIDDVTSPCIDAGDPNTPVAFEPFPNGGIINMGAYGGTAEASKSPSGRHAKYGGGTGEPNDPYLIHSAEQMNAIGAELNDWDKHFKLMADIDLSSYTGTDFNIIGTGYLPAFTGVFDGDGHTISNFTYTSTDSPCIGIFGYIEGPNAHIINLGLIDPNVDAGTGIGVGPLAGWIDMGSVTNCYAVDGSIAGEGYVGDLVGISAGTIADCYATGNVTGIYHVGGLVGHNRGTINDCYSTAGAFGNDNVGGLAGYNNSGTIINCSAMGSVSGIDRNAGGLAGSNRGAIVNCSAEGNVLGRNFVGGLVGANDGSITTSCSSASIEGRYEVGGLVGHNSHDAEIVDCYARGDVLGQTRVGGLVGGNIVGGGRAGGLLSGSIRNCYSVATVSGDEQVGGLAGRSESSKVNSSFWDIETSGQTTSDGGMGKTTAEMQDPNTFIDAGWDFVGAPAGRSDVWAEPDGGGYPILWWQLSPPPELPTFSGGTGKPDDPYLISTADELNSIGRNPRLMAENFKLIADIDLAGVNSFIIGGQWHPFRGMFDGNGHTISNFSYASVEANYIGLFGNAVGAEIKNLGLINPHLNVERGNHHGSLVGRLDAGTVVNCYVEAGSISGNSGVGGLLGANQGIVTNCWSTCGIDAGNDTGGLVGENEGSIMNSWSYADVNGRNAVGGLVGRNAPGEIVNCYARGSVAGQWYVGGLVGSNAAHSWSIAGTIRNCYSATTVTKGSQTGGLVGGNVDGEVTACFWDVETSGRTRSYGGTPKTTAEMQMAGTFLDAGWDFVNETENGSEDIWCVCQESGYPTLAGKNVPQ